MASECILKVYICLLERYFDGQVIRSTSTKEVLAFPNYLTRQLPSVPFEANLNEAGKTKVVLKVFDSADPKKFHLGYTDRLDYLRQRITPRLLRNQDMVADHRH